MPPPFFFEFIAVDEGWSAMKMMRVQDEKQNEIKPRGICYRSTKTNKLEEPFGLADDAYARK
jgi:hypothetical protein